MWVESQDGVWLVNLNNTKELYISNTSRHPIYADDTLLGMYPTEEVAKRALRYLKDEIAEHGYSSEYLCRMPKSMEMEAGHETV